MLVILPGVMDVSLAQTSWAMVFESEHRYIKKICFRIISNSFFLFFEISGIVRTFYIQFCLENRIAKYQLEYVFYRFYHQKVE